MFLTGRFHQSDGENTVNSQMAQSDIARPRMDFHITLAEQKTYYASPP